MICVPTAERAENGTEGKLDALTRALRETVLNLERVSEEAERALRRAREVMDDLALDDD